MAFLRGKSEAWQKGGGLPHAEKDLVERVKREARVKLGGRANTERRAEWYKAETR